MNRSIDNIKNLIQRAASADSSLVSMQLSQAALNAANAIRTVADIPTKSK